MLVTLVIAAFVAFLIWDYAKKRRLDAYFQKAGIKGPKYLPVIGNLLMLFFVDTKNIFEIFKFFQGKYGKTWRLFVLNDISMTCSDPQYFESIMSSQKLIRKSILYELLLPWLGDGLLNSNGAKWHSRRKIITPTFHFKILEQFVETFDQQSTVMAKRLHERADGKTAIDIFPEACLTALDVIAETAMGVKVNAQSNPNIPYAKAVTDTSFAMSNRFVQPQFRHSWIYYLFRPIEAYRTNKQIALMHKFTDDVIQERRRVLEQAQADGSAANINDELNSDDVGLKKRMAFLDVLLQATHNGKPLSNADIREEVDTFMFEGHDTTTSGIAHTLYLISRYPEVQKKLIDEIHDVIGADKTKPITMRELQDLKYLECVIKESLRLYPPVPAISRVIENEVELNGHMIPANTQVTLLLYAACKDPDYFDEPESFKPERFFAEAENSIKPFAYVPFSAGPRNCVGQKFAMLELKSTVSKMLRHFELLPLGPEVEPLFTMIMRSSTGVHVGLRPRN